MTGSTTPQVNIPIDEIIQDEIVSTFQIKGQNSTLESFSDYLTQFSQQPKTFDADTNNFIIHIIDVSPDKIKTVLTTLYTNDDKRSIPNPDQFKKPNETLDLQVLRKSNDYLYNANYDATGKTNKKVCEDVKAAKLSKAKLDKTTLSTYAWPSYQG